MIVLTVQHHLFSPYHSTCCTTQPLAILAVRAPRSPRGKWGVGTLWAETGLLQNCQWSVKATSGGAWLDHDRFGKAFCTACTPPRLSLLEVMPVWVQLAQPDGTVDMVNEAACRISGYGRSEMIGQTWPYPWFLDDWRVEGGDPLVELLQTGDVLASEVSCVTRRREHKVLSVTMSLLSREPGQPQGVLMVAQDITERKR